LQIGINDQLLEAQSSAVKGMLYAKIAQSCEACLCWMAEGI